MISPRTGGGRLPDLLETDLRLVVCGSAAGTRSAAAGAYYAGPGNKFWSILFETGLTPERLQPKQFPKLLSYGIGLTDLAKNYAGGDAGIKRADDDCARLAACIATYKPAWLAFNGKRAASVFLGRQVQYGVQREDISHSRISHTGTSHTGTTHTGTTHTGTSHTGTTHTGTTHTGIAVMPSTSGAAQRYWDAAPWHALARLVLAAAE